MNLLEGGIGVITIGVIIIYLIICGCVCVGLRSHCAKDDEQNPGFFRRLSKRYTGYRIAVSNRLFRVSFSYLST